MKITHVFLTLLHMLVQIPDKEYNLQTTQLRGWNQA